MKRIIPYEIFENNLYSLTFEETKFLDTIVKGEWHLNKSTGLIDVEGSIEIEKNYEIENFEGIKFGHITKHIYIDSTSINSLVGLPDQIGGNLLLIDNRNLKSLYGIPKKIEGSVLFYGNSLESLNGGPEFIGRNFRIEKESNIFSLEGISKEIKGTLMIEFCYNLKSIENLNKLCNIGYSFKISNCSLTSLKGCPGIIRGSFSCLGNNLSSLAGGPKKILSGLYNCGNNPLESFKYLPEESKEGFEFFIDSIFKDKDRGLPVYTSYRKSYRTKWDYTDILEDMIEFGEKTEHLLEIFGPTGISNILKKDEKIFLLKNVWHIIEKKEWYNEIKYPNKRVKEILTGLNLLSGFGL